MIFVEGVMALAAITTLVSGFDPATILLIVEGYRLISTVVVYTPTWLDIICSENII